MAQLFSVMAIVTIMVLLLGSCDFRTRCDYGPVRSLSGPYEVDGFGQWAGVTAVFGIVALVLLCAGTARLSRDRCADRDRLRLATGSAIFAALCLALDAVVAGRYWQSVLAERDVVTYAIRIAPGLPVVTIAGVIGAALCALIVGCLLFEQRTNGFG